MTGIGGKSNGFKNRAGCLQALAGKLPDKKPSLHQRISDRHLSPGGGLGKFHAMTDAPSAIEPPQGSEQLFAARAMLE